MPLSEANMLPLHFFSCPISLSLAPPIFFAPLLFPLRVSIPQNTFVSRHKRSWKTDRRTTGSGDQVTQ